MKQCNLSDKEMRGQEIFEMMFNFYSAGTRPEFQLSANAQKSLGVPRATTMSCNCLKCHMCGKTRGSTLGAAREQTMRRSPAQWRY